MTAHHEVNGTTLTGREYDVLVTYGQPGVGTYKATAHRLGMSEHTAKNYGCAVIAKLDAASIVDAYARLGWLCIPEVT